LVSSQKGCSGIGPPFANNANLIRAVSSHEVWLRPNAIQDGAALKSCRTGDLPQRNLGKP
jgi:hypothetical protein